LNLKTLSFSNQIMDLALGHYYHSLKGAILFAKQCLCNPRKTGSIYPSSPALGRTMVSFLENRQDSTIIELGPGTGSITKTLLSCNIDLERFYACEISPCFSNHLKKHFPEINVCTGDASDLTGIFKELIGSVDCIFSGLPLKSLPSDLVEKIIDQEYEMLRPQGIIVQFSYDLRSGKSLLRKKFKQIGSKIVVANFPPARVDAFVKDSEL